jgi:hypothetical protein
MKSPAFALRQISLSLVVAGAMLSSADGVVPPHQVKQTPEVVEAYRVCLSFAHLLGENLDFDRAYEATFTRNPAQRRAIAIADGEFGDLDFAKIDDELLIKAYKLRMQNIYLMLPLAGPSDVEASLFFPPDIKEILQRKAPTDPSGFASYVSQLERDVAHFRAHLDRLSSKYPFVADRIQSFRSEALSIKGEPPNKYKVKPAFGYLRAEVLRKDEPYYDIDGLIVARDHDQMRIVGIRFFNRLF